jgi:hypothetical protein
MKLSNGFKKIGQKTPVAAAKEPVKAPAPAPASAACGNKTVRIEAKIDVGFGNGLYLRGEGHGLSWDKGIPLLCIDNSTWAWSGESPGKLKFKLLLNDTVWAKGEDLVAGPGERVALSPSF